MAGWPRKVQNCGWLAALMAVSGKASTSKFCQSKNVSMRGSNPDGTERGTAPQ